MTLTTIEVGKPLGGRQAPRPEGVIYQLEAGGHTVYAVLDDPSDAEVKAYRFGKVELAAYVEQPAIFVLMQVGILPWCDAPYSWHLVPEAHRPTFEAKPDGVLQASERELLTVILIDARTSIVRALRTVSMPQDVSEAIRSAMRTQATAPWDPRAYDAALARITRTHETPALLARASARGTAGT